MRVITVRFPFSTLARSRQSERQRSSLISGCYVVSECSGSYWWSADKGAEQHTCELGRHPCSPGSHSRNRLLAWRGSGVENVFASLILHGVAKLFQLLEDRKNRLPAQAQQPNTATFSFTSNSRAFCAGSMWIVRLQLLAQAARPFCLQSPSPIRVQNFAHGHGAGKGVQNADLDGVFSAARTVELHRNSAESVNSIDAMPREIDVRQDHFSRHSVDAVHALAEFRRFDRSRR